MAYEALLKKYREGGGVYRLTRDRELRELQENIEEQRKILRRYGIEEKKKEQEFWKEFFIF